MPTWLTNRLCLPIWQLWPICTRLSILVPSPMRVAWKVLRSMVVQAPISASGDFHPAELRHLNVPAVVQPIAEAVRSDHGVGVDDNSVPQNRIVIKHGSWINGDVVADPAKSADDRMAVYPAAGADGSPFADHGQGMDAGIGPTTDQGVYHGPRIDAERFLFRPGLKVTHDGHKGHQRIGRLNEVLALDR